MNPNNPIYQRSTNTTNFTNLTGTFNSLNTPKSFKQLENDYKTLSNSYQQLYEYNKQLIESLTIKDIEGRIYSPNDLIKFLDQANEEINQLKSKVKTLETENKLHKSFRNLIACDEKIVSDFFGLSDEILALAPLYFRCALTNKIMSDPVIDNDGYSYERNSIVDWLSLNKQSPITSLPLYVSDLRSNFALKSAIIDWVRMKQAENGLNDDEEQSETTGPILTDGTALVHFECNETIPSLSNYVSINDDSIDLSDIKWKAKIKDQVHRDIINTVHTSTGLAHRLKKMSPSLSKPALDYLDQVGVMVKELFAHVIQKHSIISIYQKFRKCFVIFCKVPEQKQNVAKDRIFTMIRIYCDFLITEAIKKISFKKTKQPTNFVETLEKAKNLLLEMAIDEETPRNAEVTIIGCDVPIRLILVVNGLYYSPPKKSIK